MKKGYFLTESTGMIIFMIIVAVLILALFGSLSQNSPSGISDFFYRLLTGSLG